MDREELERIARLDARVTRVTSGRPGIGRSVAETLAHLAGGLVLR